MFQHAQSASDMSQLLHTLCVQLLVHETETNAKRLFRHDRLKQKFLLELQKILS